MANMKGNSVNSPSLPVRPNGCVLLNRVRTTLMKLRIRYVSALTPCNLPQSSVETKSVVSDWLLPKIARSATSSSTRRPSQNQPPGEGTGIYNLLGKNRSLPSHLHRKCPKKMGPTRRRLPPTMLFFSNFIVGKTRTLSHRGNTHEAH